MLLGHVLKVRSCILSIFGVICLLALQLVAYGSSKNLKVAF